MQSTSAAGDHKIKSRSRIRVQPFIDRCVCRQTTKAFYAKTFTKRTTIKEVNPFLIFSFSFLASSKSHLTKLVDNCGENWKIDGLLILSRFLFSHSLTSKFHPALLTYFFMDSLSWSFSFSLIIAAYTKKREFMCFPSSTHSTFFWSIRERKLSGNLFDHFLRTFETDTCSAAGGILLLIFS